MAKRSLSLFIRSLKSALIAEALATSAFAGQQVPIQGDFVGTLEATPLSVSSFHVTLAAVGHASHLGLSEVALSAPELQVDFANQQLITNGVTWVGSTTAANGDQIFWEYRFRDAAVPFTLLGEAATFAVDLVVTGGTGRFTGATGGGEAHIESANLLSQTFSVHVEGRISTVGSLKQKH